MKPPLKRYLSVKTASAAQHREIVKDIFSTITPRYDSLNHVLSLRRDVMWRRFAVSRICLFRTYRFLDVATGTADLAMGVVLRYPHARVVGLDLAGEMMAYAYLADSIANFLPPRRFLALMAEAGLEHVQAYPLTLGITQLFVGQKPLR